MSRRRLLVWLEVPAAIGNDQIEDFVETALRSDIGTHDLEDWRRQIDKNSISVTASPERKKRS